MWRLSLCRMRRDAIRFKQRAKLDLPTSSSFDVSKLNLGPSIVGDESNADESRHLQVGTRSRSMLMQTERNVRGTLSGD